MTLSVHKAAERDAAPRQAAAASLEAPTLDAPPSRRHSAALTAVAGGAANGATEQDAETGKMSRAGTNVRANATASKDAETGKMTRAAAAPAVAAATAPVPAAPAPPAPTTIPAPDEAATDAPPPSIPSDEPFADDPASPANAADANPPADRPSGEHQGPATAAAERAPTVPRPGVPRPNASPAPKPALPNTQQLQPVEDPLNAPTADLPAMSLPAAAVEVPEDSAMDQVVVEGWTLKRYAWLCAELSHAPERVDEVWLVYGVREPGIRRTVMGAWNARLGQEDALRQRHATLIERFRGMLADT